MESWLIFSELGGEVKIFLFEVLRIKE